jgi:tRNA 2-thiouridine synthesizing protein A
MEVNINQTLDCKGLSCPMPMLKLAKTMKGLSTGEVLEMFGTDPGTNSDLPKWCEKFGNELLLQESLDGGVFRYLIKKS